MTVVRGSSSTACDNASLAGNKAISQADGSQQNPTVENPLSLIRTVLMILELAGEWTRSSGYDPNGDIRLRRHEAADVTNKLGEAIALLVADQARPALLAEARAVIAEGNKVLAEIELREIEQTNLELLIPRQSAPAFRRREG